MSDPKGGSDGGQYASPPCFMHELQPGFRPQEGDGQARSDVMRWRKAERQRLIDARLAIPAAERSEMANRIAEGLDDVIGEPGGRIASLYWPFRGEPDLRGWAARFIGRGGRIALPFVVEKARPLEFRQWQPGDRLARGVWNIPYPEDGEPVVPDIAIAPLVGWDPKLYRLGYGGGYFDRTLASIAPKPQAVGVGYSFSALPTIYPFDHDIAMDAIVTETHAIGSA